MRCPSKPTPLASLLALLFLSAAPTVQAQVFVYPRHADQSQVRYFDFDWAHVDILVGPEADRRLSEDTAPTTPHVPPGSIGSSAIPAGDRPMLQSPGGGGLPTSSGAGPSDGGTGAPDGGTPAPTPGGAPDAGPWVGPTDGGTLGPRTGGVRLYFYDREKDIASRAVAMITDSYRYLVGRFNYVPTQTFPYILYSSYQEFLQTNLFPLQEGVLGVTSPRDLKLTLPYFGDHRMFDMVSAHEMAHQFTIQKVRTFTEATKQSGDPLEAMPLWFIEGLAEYYAQRGIDPEAEMLVRDILVNPNVEKGYAMLDFFEDRPYSVLWTYKGGQVRCAFLEETYGEGIIQRLLEQSTALLSGTGLFRKPEVDFKQLLQKLTGDDSRTTSKKFEAWLKQRAFRSYLDSTQDALSVEGLEDFDAPVDSIAASQDGSLLLYRTADMDTGRAKLVLIDRRAPGKGETVVVDNVPGAESLHAGFGRNFDVSDGAVVYVAESRGRDVLHWAPIEHRAEKRDPTNDWRLDPMRPNAPPTRGMPRKQDELWNVTLRVGDAVHFPLAQKGLLAVYSPTLSPDGKRIAFVGLSDAGVRDLYMLDVEGAGGGDLRLTRLTDDIYAERQVTWGKEGIVFSSDATAHGKYNLFRVRPDRPLQIERLTTEERDELDPKVLPDGRLFFVAYAKGRADIHEVANNQIIRRTDISTGFFDVNPGPDGGLWAVHHYGGERKPVLLKRQSLLSLEHVDQPAATPPRPLPQLSLEGAKPYRPYSPQNWELGPIVGFVGGGGEGIYGQVFGSASDRLRNHGLILNLALFGSFERTSGLLFYINQERQLTWGGGPFQAFNIRFDRTFSQVPWQFQSYERFYGLTGTVRYPFDRFVYVQGDLAVGGVSYFIPPEVRLFLALPELNLRGDLLNEWYAANQTRLQTEVNLRLGYDTLRYYPGAGPIGGHSVLLEATGDWHPTYNQVFGSLRLDAAQYFGIFGRTHMVVRGGGGVSAGGPLARQFFLSSFDTIRGIPFGLTSWLLGKNYFFSTAELRIPLNSIIRLIIFSDIEAIAGADFGAVSDDLQQIWGRRVLDYVFGVNFGLGPLIIRLHFAKPVDVGLRDASGNPVYPNGNGDWVTNFSIGLAGFPGFAADRHTGSGPNTPLMNIRP